jgi:hypothetical protein
VWCPQFESEKPSRDAGYRPKTRTEDTTLPDRRSQARPLNAPPTRASSNHAGSRALRWRDPDSNRGHHDFQTIVRNTRTRAERPAIARVRDAAIGRDVSQKRADVAPIRTRQGSRVLIDRSLRPGTTGGRRRLLWRSHFRSKRAPSARPTRLAGDDRFHKKQHRADRSASSVRTAQLHGRQQSGARCCLSVPAVRVAGSSSASAREPSRHLHAAVRQTPLSVRRDPVVRAPSRPRLRP